MVVIEYDKNFKKHFRLRIFPNRNLYKKFAERLSLFVKDRSNPILRDHKLTGSLKGSRAFSVTGNYRVTYIEVKNGHYIFIDIGTHPQIYE